MLSNNIIKINNFRDILLKIAFIFITFIFILSNVFAENMHKTDNYERYKAKVIEDIVTYTQNENNVKTQKVKIKIISNCEYKDKEYESEYILQVLDMAEARELKKGDIVYVSLSNKVEEEGKVSFIIEDVNRIPYIMFIVLLFMFVLLIVGRKQGFKTIISLLITFISIFYILLPSIIAGKSAIISSLIVCIIIAVVSFIIISGFTKKSFVAMLGTIFGVLVSAALAIVVSKLGNITGLVNSEAQMLVYISEEMKIDINGLLFAGIIIGTIGATMDIAMSIASSMTEIDENAKDISIKELIKAGMNVGRDAMGTMSNTLILAYVGEAIILIMIFMINTSDILYILNSDMIATEILRGLCSTIGMILTIPLTAWCYGFFKKISNKKIRIDLENKKERIK